MAEQIWTPYLEALLKLSQCLLVCTRLLMLTLKHCQKEKPYHYSTFLLLQQSLLLLSSEKDCSLQTKHDKPSPVACSPAVFPCMQPPRAAHPVYHGAQRCGSIVLLRHGVAMCWKMIGSLSRPHRQREDKTRRRRAESYSKLLFDVAVTCTGHFRQPL
mmetsp:Transcript_66202/g.111065  ORF Transcript_66202/g.111065 Transcript_66202/m.111065 type:complete len:158 (+) Transcript_66202:248-721(+)